MHIKPFDFNIHLSGGQESDREFWLAKETSNDVHGLRQCYQTVRGQLRSALSGANFMLFNQDLPFLDVDLGSWITEVRLDFPTSIFTQLLDFRRPFLEQALLRLKTFGVQGVKFHSYVQKIGNSDIRRAVEAAEIAAAHGFYICIDASYGTTWMYDFDNMLLAANIVRAVKDVPVVILHSGGARRWDAMLLALDAPNVYLETSFTLNYFEGSSVESDLAFIYRKIGLDRILYASDFPYVSLDDSFRCIERFLERHGFGAFESDAVLVTTAKKLIGKVDVPSRR